MEDVQSYFDKPTHIHQNVNILTGNLTERKLLEILVHETPLKSWLTSPEQMGCDLQGRTLHHQEKSTSFRRFLPQRNYLIRF